MFKRRQLTNQFHQIVLNDKIYEEEASCLTKDFAVWTKEERKEVCAFEEDWKLIILN